MILEAVRLTKEIAHFTNFKFRAHTENFQAVGGL